MITFLNFRGGVLGFGLIVSRSGKNILQISMFHQSTTFLIQYETIFEPGASDKQHIYFIVISFWNVPSYMGEKFTVVMKSSGSFGQLGS